MPWARRAEGKYSLPLPEQGELQRTIDTYTKEHSAEYQSQALIDLAHRSPAISPRSSASSSTPAVAPIM